MDRTDIIVNRLDQCIFDGEVSNKGMCRIIHDIEKYLGLKDLTAYAQSKNISYQAARKHKTEKIMIAGKEFVIDND